MHNWKYGDIIHKYHEHYVLLKFTEASSGSLKQPLVNVVKDKDELAI